MFRLIMREGLKTSKLGPTQAMVPSKYAVFITRFQV